MTAITVRNALAAGGGCRIPRGGRGRQLPRFAPKDDEKYDRCRRDGAEEEPYPPGGGHHAQHADRRDCRDHPHGRKKNKDGDIERMYGSIF